jgi:hypothetical protein
VLVRSSKKRSADSTVTVPQTAMCHQRRLCMI